jgi:hypothetical protein
MFSRGETRLQRLGRISNVSPSGNAIVKAENPPKIGSEVQSQPLMQLSNPVLKYPPI